MTASVATWRGWGSLSASNASQLGAAVSKIGYSACRRVGGAAVSNG